MISSQFDKLKIWNQIPEDIKHEIKLPLNNYENILFLAKNISVNLDLNQQELLLNYMQGEPGVDLDVERITIKLITKHGWLLLTMELFQLVLNQIL